MGFDESYYNLCTVLFLTNNTHIIMSTNLADYGSNIIFFQLIKQLLQEKYRY
jgi:hypothetical protein